MSLLADLLSKKTKGENEPRAGKDIPPTLVRAQNAPPKSSGLKNRYAIISLGALAAIAIGILMPSQFGRLTSVLLQKTAANPEQVKLPLPHKAGPAVVSAIQQPPAAPVAAQPEKAAAMPAASKPPSRPGVKKSRKSGAAKKNSAGAAIPSNVISRANAPRKTAPEQPGRTAETRTAVAAPIENGAPLANSLLYAARSAELAGDWRTALASYRKALKIEPHNFRIMSNAAAALNNLGMFEEGARQARQALDQKPDYVPALINAAIAYSSKGNSQEALRLFSAASAADPGNRNLLVNLGILQERVGKLDEALETYRSLAAIGDPQALHGLGRIYERKGNRAEAVNAYRQVMALRDAGPAVKKEVKARLAGLEE